MGEYQRWQWGTQRGLEPLNTMVSHRAAEPHPSLILQCWLQYAWVAGSQYKRAYKTYNSSPRGDPLIDRRPYRHNTTHTTLTNLPLTYLPTLLLWLHLTQFYFMDILSLCYFTRTMSDLGLYIRQLYFQIQFVILAFWPKFLYKLKGFSCFYEFQERNICNICKVCKV